MKTKHLIPVVIALSMIIAIYLMTTRSPQHENKEMKEDENSSHVASHELKPGPQTDHEGMQSPKVTAPAPDAEEPNTHPLPEAYMKAVPLVGNKVPDSDYYDKVGGVTSSDKYNHNRKMILLENEENAYYYITNLHDNGKMIMKLPSFFPGTCLISWQWLDNDRVLGSYGSADFIDEMPFWSKLCVYDIPTNQLFRLELPDGLDASFVYAVLRSGEVRLTGFRGRWTGTNEIPLPEGLKYDDELWFTVPPTSELKKYESK